MLPDERYATLVPVLESSSETVHGVWVCSHQGAEPKTLPPPTWAFLWDLETGSSVRSEAVGDVPAPWADAGVPVRRSIAESFRAFELGDAGPILAVLTRKADGAVTRRTVVEHRLDGDHEVHFVARMGSLPNERSGAGNPLPVVRGLSVDLGITARSPESEPYLGDRVAGALTASEQYRAISDPDTLTLLYWHGPPAPRIDWSANTATRPILHPEDEPTARQTAKLLKSSEPGPKVDLTLRFLTTGGEYEPIPVKATLIDLESGERALLAILTVR